MPYHLTFIPGPEIPPLLHNLKDERAKLELLRHDLEGINKVLLDHTIPVAISRGRHFHLWEGQAWRAFQAMSAQDKRPIIERSCAAEIEKVSQTLVAVKNNC
jgi:hypothetical protein